MLNSSFARSMGGSAQGYQDRANPQTHIPMEMWGTEHAVRMSDTTITVPPNKQQDPGNQTYRFAFILCAKSKNDISDDVASLDILRQYWDIAFRLATGNIRKSQSTLT